MSFSLGVLCQGLNDPSLAALGPVWLPGAFQAGASHLVARGSSSEFLFTCTKVSSSAAAVAAVNSLGDGARCP